MTKMTLNLKGLNCPLPVIRSIRAVKLLLAGDILQVLVTDRGGYGFRGILRGHRQRIGRMPGKRRRIHHRHPQERLMDKLFHAMANGQEVGIDIGAPITEKE